MNLKSDEYALSKSYCEDLNGRKVFLPYFTCYKSETGRYPVTQHPEAEDREY